METSPSSGVRFLFFSEISKKSKSMWKDNISVFTKVMNVC
jgi:hypothetical protein